MARVYAILAAIGAIIMTIFGAFRAGSKSKANEIKAEAEQAAREYRDAGAEATIAGLDRERKIINEKVDTASRDHFSNGV